jgi:hypothetical protein
MRSIHAGRHNTDNSTIVTPRALFLIGSPFTESASASAESRSYSIVALDDERARSFPTACGGKANGENKANLKPRLAIPFLEPGSGKTRKEKSNGALVLVER